MNIENGLPQGRRDFFGQAAKMGKIEAGHAEHQMADARIHLFPQPGGDLSRRANEGVFRHIATRTARPLQE